jgi:predicted NBD/HSP70 family sugar kinase
LVSDGFYVVGITINISRTIISIFNSKNEEVSGPHIFPIKIKPDLAIFNLVNTELEKVITGSHISHEKILVTGIELPGLINPKLGINKTYFPGVDNLLDELRKIFGTKVVFNHDAKVRTFAEQHFGLAKNRKHVLMLQADWGLGLGIIVNGKLYSGKSGYSGEFGHLPIVDNGILCSCGKNGCLETMVSAVAIARMAKEGIEKGNSSLIMELVKNEIEKIDISVVLQAANLGDQFAISLLNVAGHWLGKGIAFLIQIFNPDLIILGGRVAEAKQFILAPIQQAIHTYSNHEISSNTEIKFSDLGARAGTMGIAAYALDKLSFTK